MAKASTKQLENTKRLRYIRTLERFSKSITNYLFKADEITKDIFDKKVDNNLKYLTRTEKVHLYKGEYNDLEKLVEKIIAYRQGEETIETLKDALLYEANQIEKSMNQRRYKKDKHSQDKFKEWE
ncbi:MAG: hypothetical protein DRG24_01780 [Epsilonproteobacteria bacterium]|nr:MAG: hypothetical protein DRG24_01780 [Campylobacterota bacterium]